MKIGPVIDALERRDITTTLVHTGQHYDPNMSQVFFEELGLRPPDQWLNVGSGTHAEQTARVMLGIEPLILDLDPTHVVVVGDINSTMAAALVAAKLGKSVAHVEAGLRSGDWSMPEEVNRVVTDRVSDLLFATSPDAVDNLRSEGYQDDRIHLVGNVMIDTLLANLDRALARPVLETLNLIPGEYGLVTLHRPVNVDRPEILEGLLHALGQVARECRLVLPVHPRTLRQLQHLQLPDNLLVIDPLGYLDFMALEANARIVLTDSGGIQEETTALGVPCLTLRNNTERPITVSEGTNFVVGTDPNRIISEAKRVLREGVPARHPKLWDGRAGERIGQILAQTATRTSTRLLPVPNGAPTSNRHFRGK
jgi:UDP-N-acetylglucosamine 2-epimerase (non-hydrolysing)